MPRSSIPKRPAAAKLPDLAVERFGARVVADFEAAGAPLVITLGQEVFQTLIKLPQLSATAPQTAAGDVAGSLTECTTTGTATAGPFE